jgi:hypothetical protein
MIYQLVIYQLVASRSEWLVQLIWARFSHPNGQSGHCLRSTLQCGRRTIDQIDNESYNCYKTDRCTTTEVGACKARAGATDQDRVQRKP